MKVRKAIKNIREDSMLRIRLEDPRGSYIIWEGNIKDFDKKDLLDEKCTLDSYVYKEDEAGIELNLCSRW